MMIDQKKNLYFFSHKTLLIVTKVNVSEVSNIFEQPSQRLMRRNQENRQDKIQEKIRNFGKNQDIVNLILILLSTTKSA